MNAKVELTTLTRDDLVALDKADPLSTFRDQFNLPEGIIYLDGNSLGAQPKKALEVATDVVTRQWGHDLIKSWNTSGWWELSYDIMISGEWKKAIYNETDSVT